MPRRRNGLREGQLGSRGSGSPRFKPEMMPISVKKLVVLPTYHIKTFIIEKGIQIETV